jgi:hypothetical protein
VPVSVFIKLKEISLSVDINGLQHSCIRIMHENKTSVFGVGTQNFANASYKYLMLILLEDATDSRSNYKYILDRLKQMNCH